MGNKECCRQLLLKSRAFILLTNLIFVLSNFLSVLLGWSPSTPRIILENHTIKTSKIYIIFIITFVFLAGYYIFLTSHVKKM